MCVYFSSFLFWEVSVVFSSKWLLLRVQQLLRQSLSVIFIWLLKCKQHMTLTVCTVLYVLVCPRLRGLPCRKQASHAPPYLSLVLLSHFSLTGWWLSQRARDMSIVCTVCCNPRVLLIHSLAHRPTSQCLLAVRTLRSTENKLFYSIFFFGLWHFFPSRLLRFPPFSSVSLIFLPSSPSFTLTQIKQH